MKKFLILTATILLSAMAASAQTATRRESPGQSTKADQREASRRERGGALGLSLVVKVGPSSTYLKNGLSLGEVVRLLGQPASVSEQLDGERRVITYRFARSAGRVLVAEFADGLLLNSRTESSESLVQNESGKAARP